MNSKMVRMIFLRWFSDFERRIMTNMARYVARVRICSVLIAQLLHEGSIVEIRWIMWASSKPGMWRA